MFLIYMQEIRISGEQEIGRHAISDSEPSENEYRVVSLFCFVLFFVNVEVSRVS